MKVILPIPTGVNALYKSGYNRITGKIMWYKSQKAQSWLEESLYILKKEKRMQEEPKGKEVKITWYFKDKKRRDIDSGLKVCLDAIVQAGIIEDDSIVEHLDVWKIVDRKLVKSYCSVEVV